MEALWFVVVAGGPILLLIGIFYGMSQYRKRNRSLDPLADEATRRLREDQARENAEK